MSADDYSLIPHYIIEDPGQTGPSGARILPYGVPVWALIGYLHAVHDDVSRVARDYAVPEVAVRASIAYYSEHRPAIDARLRQNSEPVA